MAVLTLRNILTSGQASADYGITDIVTLPAASGGTAVYVLSNNGTSLTSYHIAADGSQTTAGFVAVPGVSLSPNAELAVVYDGNGDATHLALKGAASSEIRLIDLGSGGAIALGNTVSGFSNGANMQAVAGTSDGLLFRDADGDGFTRYAVTDTAPSAAATYDVNGTANSVSALATAQIGTAEIVIAAADGGTSGQAASGVSTYVLNADGTVDLGDSLQTSDGTGMMIPTDVATIEIGQTSYAVVSSMAGNSGALSVLRVDDQGNLSPMDHVLDTLNTRFGAAQVVETISIEGRGFVVAAGGDAGVSIFQLLPHGRLLHLETVADTLATTLAGVTALSLSEDDGALQIFAASGSEAGLTELLYTPATAMLEVIGTAGNDTLAGSLEDDVILGGDGDDYIKGRRGDDIMVDGAGVDQMEGNKGNDVFVLMPDGQPDFIVDFNPALDTLDLSNWAFMYDPSRIEMIPTGDGMILRWLDEELTLHHNTGSPLSEVQVINAIIASPTRSFMPPSYELDGSEGDDTLMGDWGQDILRGNGGDDRLIGGDGDDLIFGGSGDDTAVVNDAISQVSFDLSDPGRVHIASGDGQDIFEGVEWYEFSNITVSQDTLHHINAALTDQQREIGHSEGDFLGTSAAELIFAHDGDDTIIGGGGEDLIIGGMGDDRLEGGGLADLIYGGQGDDLIKGASGNDILEGGDGKNKIYGQNGADTITGGVDRDFINGGEGADYIQGFWGDDTLLGGTQDDEIHGGKGDDSLEGNQGDDQLFGGKGADTLKGGKGDDTLRGGEGNDQLFGNSGVDTFVFGRSDGVDVVNDFNISEDQLVFESTLVGEGHTAETLLQTYGTLTDTGVLLEFDQGETVLIRDIAAIDDLVDSISIL